MANGQARRPPTSMPTIKTWDLIARVDDPACLICGGPALRDAGRMILNTAAGWKPICRSCERRAVA